MSVTVAPLTEPRRGLARVTAAASDALAVTGRNLIALRRVPQLIVFSTIQPVIFVLLWRYVFGGAIDLGAGVPYVDFLMPGIFVQTVVFGAMGAAVGLAADLKTGLLERFHALPMARSAVLAGRTLADLMRNVFVVALMVAVGFAVGFRVHTDVPGFLAGMLLVLLFGYALSWVFATLGLLVSDPETAQAAGFPIVAPLVFASNAFVPPETMPSWLQAFAEHQPVSATISAVRALVLGPPPGESTGWLVLQALTWMAGIILVFAPLAVRRYRQAV
ncbi:MAG TPA: ABC transporter permease [Actinomycetota bacterium]|nr:ABC transporter permease [Actinomycetota bacterium]